MKTSIIVFIIVSILSITSCINNKDTVNQINGTIVLYPKYAKGFYVERMPDSSLSLIIRNPSDTNNIISNILLHDGDVDKTSRVGCLSISHISFLDKLGVIDKVVGIPDTTLFDGSPILQKINENAQQITLGSGVKTETIIGMHPDFLFTSFYQDVNLGSLRSSTLVIPIVEYLELHPLGRMEWIKLFGFLMDELQVANLYCEDVFAKYNALKNAHVGDSTLPDIVDVSEYHGHWYAAGGQSYIAQLYKDAGYNYIWSDDEHNGSFPVSSEVAVKAGMETEYWRFVSEGKEGEEKVDIATLNDYYGLFSSVKTGKVLYCNPTLSGYFTEGVLEPHIVLQDMINARDSMDGYTPKYYKRYGRSML